jgi:DNA adenine methylase
MAIGALDITTYTRAPEISRSLEGLKPPLKWAGGKRWLVPHLRKLWEGHSDRRLVEPFVGGLAVSLGLQPQAALLNDANPHLINFYRSLQDGLKTRLPMGNSRVMFDTHRKRFNSLIDAGKAETAEAAALFYYLNRTGFNGLCRFNSDGFFNVPFGAYNTITYTNDFSAFESALAEWEFVHGDFQDLSVEADDFIYADPPYDVDFTQYSKDAFTWDDQVRLAEWLAEHRGPVVISNQATDRIVKLYRKNGFKLRFLDAPRRISCNGDRTPAREVLAFKNL